MKFQASMTFRLTTETVQGVAFADFKGNSLVDPFGDQSATQQPTGLDQWANFYQRYYVGASKLSIDVQNLTAAVAPRFVVYPTQGFSQASLGDWTITSFKPYEMPHAQHRMINSSGGGRPLHMKAYMSTVKIFGTKTAAQDTLWQGDMPSTGITPTDPSRLWYWNFAVLNTDLPATQCICVVLVKMTMYCKLFRRVDQISVSVQ